MTTEETFAPDTAWKHIRDLLTILISSFGLPHQIAKLVFLTRQTHSQILQWLTAAEALARRTLLIQAASLPKPNAPPPGKAKHPNPRPTHGKAGFASDDSEKWSVRFKMLPQRARPRKQADGAIWNPPPRPNALPLAIRIEALIRVAQAPEKYAQRLSRLLYATPQKAEPIARPIRESQPGRTNPAYSLLMETQPLALAAAARFADSS